MAWRRTYAAPPPAIAPDNALQRTIEEDPRYEPYPGGIPATESLADVCKRVWPLWEETIQPSLRAGRTVTRLPCTCMCMCMCMCMCQALSRVE